MSWYRGIAPAYLNLFIWAPFFDQLWVGTYRDSSLGWLVASALLGALLCFAVFLLAATWGFRFKRPLVVLAASTFGATGSEWLCGLFLAGFGVFWYAIALNFAIDSTLLGLRATGLLPDPATLPWHLGALSIKSPVFLCVALFWLYITRLAILMRLSGVVVALMKFYAPIALALLTATALWGLLSIKAQPHDVTVFSLDYPDSLVPTSSSHSALAMMVGFFAAGGLLSVDWGAAVGTRRDLLRAGLPCVLGAAAWTSIMCLVVVMNTASSPGMLDRDPRAGPADPLLMSFRWAVFEGTDLFPRTVAATILILFGLAALAPAVSSLARFSLSVTTHWPSLTPNRATLIACCIAFLLMATGQVDRLGLFYRAAGLVFAPLLGAMAGDVLGKSQGAIALRVGINPAGIVSWVSGVAAGLTLFLTTPLQSDFLAWLQPESICGMLVSACVYRLLCLFGFESGRVLDAQAVAFVEQPASLEA